jgi:dTDP-glucose 4,6-dehydratase
MLHQRILVTGGAGFIGSNFVRQALKQNSSLTTLVNLDLLTYAGNPENLKDIASDSRYHFIQGS